MSAIAPDKLTFTEARQLLVLQTTTDNQAQLFYTGDHWQKGDGWIGPSASPSDDDYDAVLNKIKRSFIFRNLVAEVVDRHLGAALGQEPHWKYASDGGDTTLTKEAEQAQVTWLGNRQRPFEESDEATPLQEAVRYLLLQRRSPMRLFIPAVHLEETIDGVVGISAANLADALDKIEFHAIDPAAGGVFVYERTRQRFGVYRYTETAEDNATLTERVEISYLDADGNTVIRVMSDAGEQAVTVPLGGRLTIYEARRPALIRDDVLALQKALNMALTMRTRNVETAGFLTTILTNADLPGKYVGEEPNRKFVPDPIRVGAGVMVSLDGRTSEDAAGNKSIVTPTIHDRQPVDVTIFDQTETALERHILQRCKQLHVILSGDAGASGESRRQAMADFVTDLMLTAKQVNDTLRWLLETSLAWASYLSDSTDRYAGLRANVRCRIKPGPLDSEMLRVYKELADADFISHELGLSLSELTDDVDAELQRIGKERKETATQGQTQIDRVNAIIQQRNQRNGENNGATGTTVNGATTGQ